METVFVMKLTMKSLYNIILSKTKQIQWKWQIMFNKKACNQFQVGNLENNYSDLELRKNQSVCKSLDLESNSCENPKVMGQGPHHLPRP